MKNKITKKKIWYSLFFARFLLVETSQTGRIWAVVVTDQFKKVGVNPQTDVWIGEEHDEEDQQNASLRLDEQGPRTRAKVDVNISSKTRPRREVQGPRTRAKVDVHISTKNLLCGIDLSEHNEDVSSNSNKTASTETIGTGYVINDGEGSPVRVEVAKDQSRGTERGESRRTEEEGISAMETSEHNEDVSSNSNKTASTMEIKTDNTTNAIKGEIRSDERSPVRVVVTTDQSRRRETVALRRTEEEVIIESEGKEEGPEDNMNKQSVTGAQGSQKTKTWSKDSTQIQQNGRLGNNRGGSSEQRGIREEIGKERKQNDQNTDTVGSSGSQSGVVSSGGARKLKATTKLSKKKGRKKTQGAQKTATKKTKKTKRIAKKPKGRGNGRGKSKRGGAAKKKRLRKRK